jgi:tRNA A37 threonylcarbamoyltransferase TsaD
MDKFYNWILGMATIFLIVIMGITIMIIQKEAIQEICKDKRDCQVNLSSVYQGAVPEGYNLSHFRKTGETIKEVNNGKQNIQK